MIRIRTMHSSRRSICLVSEKGLITVIALVEAEWTNGDQVGLRGHTDGWYQTPAFVDMHDGTHTKVKYDLFLAGSPAQIPRAHFF